MKTLIILIIIGGCLTGCSSDINFPGPQNNYYSDYRTNTIYKTKAVIMCVQEASCNLYKFGEDNRLPITPDEYRQSPKTWPEIIAVLPKNSKIEVVKIDVHKNFEAGTMMHVYGRVVQPSNTTNQVRLDYISVNTNSYLGIPILTKDPALLEEVK